MVGLAWVRGDTPWAALACGAKVRGHWALGPTCPDGLRPRSTPLDSVPVHDDEVGVSRLQYRGVPLVAPNGEAVDALLVAADESGVASRLMQALDPTSREGMRKLLSGLYVQGMREGVNRALAAAIPGDAPALEGESEEVLVSALAEFASDEVRGGRSAVQWVVERFRNSELRLPCLPESANQLNKLLSNPEHDVLQVVEVIRRDPALTTRVMQVASTSFYAVGGRAPRTLQEAVVRLGARELSRQLLAFSNKRLFSFRCKRREGQLRDVWHHALATAMVAEELARDLEDANPAAYFLHGLLHDVGRAVLLQIFDELEGENPQRFSGEDVERTMDAVHGQFGSALLQRWRFDESLSEVALFHHQPQKSFSHMRVVAAVALADAIVCRAGFGGEHDAFGTIALEAHPSALFLTVGPERLKQLVEGVSRQMNGLADLM